MTNHVCIRLVAIIHFYRFTNAFLGEEFLFPIRTDLFPLYPSKCVVSFILFFLRPSEHSHFCSWLM